MITGNAVILSPRDFIDITKNLSAWIDVLSIDATLSGYSKCRRASLGGLPDWQRWLETARRIKDANVMVVLKT